MEYPTHAEKQMALEDAIAFVTAMRMEYEEPMDFASNPRMFAYAMTVIALRALDEFGALGGDPDNLIREMAMYVAIDGE
jgi:hypothetical protein